MGKRIDMTGQRFGRLVVIKENGRDKSKKVMWLCKCDCGNEVTVVGTSLRKGDTTSCGCLRKEVATKRMKEFSKELWNNEEYRQMQSEQRRKMNEEMWKDEDFRQMKSDKTKEQWENEEFRQMHIQMNEEMWQDEEFRNKMKERMSGENNPLYKLELTEEDREYRRCQKGYDEWSRQIKEQANYTCDICNTRGCKLHSHHLDGYNWCKERRLDLTNGVCLCEQCHKEFHKLYGQGDNTKQQYIEFKESKLTNRN